MQQQDGSGSKNIKWNHFNDVTTKLNEKLEQLLTKTRLKSIKLVVTQPLISGALMLMKLFKGHWGSKFCRTLSHRSIKGKSLKIKNY